MQNVKQTTCSIIIDALATMTDSYHIKKKIYSSEENEMLKNQGCSI